MGKRFRNFLKKKNKKKEEKKRKLKIGDIEVLFETGTSGPHAPSAPTTSGHADSQAITVKPLPDTQAGTSGKEDLCQDNKSSESTEKQEKKDSSLAERSREFNDRLDEMIRQLTATETSIKEEDKRGKFHPLSSTVEEDEAMSPADRHQSYSATILPKLEQVELQLDGSTAQVQNSQNVKHSAPEKRNIRVENLLSRCLAVFERNSSLTQAPAEMQLVQEIRDVLDTDETKPAIEPKTSSRSPAELLNLKLESWDDIIARRLEAKKSNPWGRYLPAKDDESSLVQSKYPTNDAATTNLVPSQQQANDTGSSLVQSNHPANDAATSLMKSKIPDDDDDSDDECFVTAASSLTSLHSASSTTPLNISRMELLEPRPLSTDRRQQTQGQVCGRTHWPNIHEKWCQVFSLSSNWSDETTTFYDALAVVKQPKERLL